MAHKVHPKAYRIRGLEDWGSRWMTKKTDFPKTLEEDFIIREYLEGKFKEGLLKEIEIERFPGKINVMIWAAKPGLIIGRAGQGIEEAKRGLFLTLAKKLSKKDPAAKSRDFAREIKIEVREVRDLWSHASLAARLMAQQIERRIPYRRVLKQTLDKIMANKMVKGARVEVAGRLDGIEIARTQWLKAGRLPRQTIRADIDFAHARAYCTYGVVGVKVWIYKGERAT